MCDRSTVAGDKIDSFHDVFKIKMIACILLRKWQNRLRFDDSAHYGLIVGFVSLFQLVVVSFGVNDPLLSHEIEINVVSTMQCKKIESQLKIK